MAPSSNHASRPPSDIGRPNNDLPVNTTLPWLRPGEVLPTELSREYRLVLECIGRFLGAPATTDHGPLDLGGIDWRSAAACSAIHGVVPLVYHVLANGHDCTDADADVIAFLRAEHMRQGARHLAQKFALQEVVSALVHAGVDCMPIKGVSVAERMYGAPGLRRTGDIDLMVRPAQFADAISVLENAGFSHDDTVPDPFADTAGSAYHFSLYRDHPGRIHLEVHWLLCDDELFDNPASPLDSGRVWRRAIADRCFPGANQLSPEDELLYLCGHAMKHNWRAMYSLVDIALCLQRPDIDWDVVDELKRGLGPTWTFEATLILCSALFGAPLPSRLADSLQAKWLTRPRLRRLVRHVVRTWILADRVPDPDHHFVPWSKYLKVRRTLALMQRTAMGQAGYIFREMTNPDERDLLLVHLPTPFEWLRRVVRPVRLVMLHARYVLFRVRNRAMQREPAADLQRPRQRLPEVQREARTEMRAAA